MAGNAIGSASDSINNPKYTAGTKVKLFLDKNLKKERKILKKDKKLRPCKKSSTHPRSGAENFAILFPGAVSYSNDWIVAGFRKK